MVKSQFVVWSSDQAVKWRSKFFDLGLSC